ncbi:PRD domain-containing protein [Faecalicoccus pleomorphus]|uniref:PRD domain-containing protein n=3 Tax=Faecalicoccus pleomorphus TaxID=1323 RepID=A0A3E3E6M4_9FIRM|nr:PRD domain-containing protein [Faecalicoccus pleomorphus]RGD77525.1 PRD domain-containing protein [Faecalicoccus pleomorphus]
MKTNRRILRLVEYFERSPVVNLEHLQAELNLNENVIRYEIENLNDYLELLNLPLIYKKDGNYISDIRDYDALIKSLSSIYKMSPDERKNVLFYELAYRNKLNITHMMNLLDVSRNTVKSDLTFLKEELESESIHMEGYKICLNQEREIRTFIFNRWKNQFNILREKKLKKGADDILFQRISNDFRDKKISYIEEFVDEVISFTNNKDLSEIFYLYTIIMIHRLMHDYYISDNKDNNPVDVKLYQFIKDHINKVEKEFCVNLTTHEIQDLTGVLIGYNNFYYNQLFEENSIKSNLFVASLIAYVENNLNVSFEEDNILLEGLYEHTKATMYRLNHHFANSINSVDVDIGKHNEIFLIVKSGLETLADFMGAELNDEEIALFTFHFLGALQRLEEQNKIIKRALLICNSGYSTSVLLKNILQNNYNLEVLGSVSIYKLKDIDLRNVDILVSTVNSSLDITIDKKIPVIYISPFLNFKDVQILRDYGITKRRNKPDVDVKQLINIIKNNCVVINEEKLNEDLSDLFKNTFSKISRTRNLFEQINVEDIFLIDQDIRWDQMIYIAGKHLMDTNKITESYINEIFTLIADYGPHFIIKNNIGIPHARIESGAISNGISIVFSPKGIIFPDGQIVKLLIFIASKNKAELISTVLKCEELSNNKDLYKNLKQLTSKKDLADYFLKEISK